MLQDTITKLEDQIRSSPVIEEAKRTELLSLLGTLKVEIGDLARTNQEQAQSITSFTEVSAREAMRKKKDPQLISISSKGLAASVRGFEGTHPRLVGVVNRISNALANMGI